MHDITKLLIAKKLGIKCQLEYHKRYREDHLLPSNPKRTYPNFPNWGMFLQTGRTMRLIEDLYPTWQEASRGARRLGIRGRDNYNQRYKEDPRLPSTPNRMP